MVSGTAYGPIRPLRYDQLRATTANTAGLCPCTPTILRIVWGPQAPDPAHLRHHTKTQAAAAVAARQASSSHGARLREKEKACGLSTYGAKVAGPQLALPIP